MTLEKNQLVIVTGLSGAGKSTALKTLEDCDFETIDNLPLSVLENVIRTVTQRANLAIGIDCRTHGFDVEKLRIIVEKINQQALIDCHIFFMDANEQTLIKRFSETRRRHYLSDDRSIADALTLERQIMEPVKDFVTLYLDTTLLSVADTRRQIRERLKALHDGLVLNCMSFGYSKGIPLGADLVFDVRFLRNPHYDEKLRPKTGLDAAVQDFIKKDETFQPFVDQIYHLLKFLIPNYEKEGKSYLTVAFGCTGGKHRSVYLANLFTKLLQDLNVEIHCLHRDKPAS